MTLDNGAEYEGE
jgi:hypothetical protein